MEKLKSFLRQSGAKGLTKKVHRRAVQELNGGAAAIRGGFQELDAFTKEFNQYASDKKVGLQPHEMGFDNVPLELWLRYSARVDEMLPCDRGQYYSPRTPEV